MRNEKHVTEADLARAAEQDRADIAAHRRRLWRSLTTLAGWAVLASVISAAFYDLTARLFHIGR